MQKRRLASLWMGLVVLLVVLKDVSAFKWGRFQRSFGSEDEAEAGSAQDENPEDVVLLSVEEMQELLKVPESEFALLLFASWDPSRLLLLQSFRQSTRAFLRFARRRRGLFSWFKRRDPSAAIQTYSAPACDSLSQRTAGPPLVAAFDCSPRNGNSLCAISGGAALPTLLYFTPKPTRPLIGGAGEAKGQEDTLVAKTKTGFFDDPSDAYLHPRATRYKGDIFLQDAVVDWLRLMRTISALQRASSFVC